MRETQEQRGYTQDLPAKASDSSGFVIKISLTIKPLIL
jgi:hypothetical protein